MIRARVWKHSTLEKTLQAQNQAVDLRPKHITHACKTNLNSGQARAIKSAKATLQDHPDTVLDHRTTTVVDTQERAA